MNEALSNINRTCAFTGHRVLEKDFDRQRLINAVISAVKDGYNEFLSGMALGFDTECCKVINELKKSYKIKLIACVPCKNQDAGFNLKQKEEYIKLLQSADEVVVLSEKYYEGCMQKRNKFMVDNSSLIIAHVKKDFGGTAFTINYALKENKQVIYV